jgi:hypothetical protein
MMQILTSGLFLTCTDNSFYFTHTNNHKRARSYLKKEKKEGKYPYLEGRSLVHGGNFPFSQVPCLKAIALAPLALPSPPPYPLPVKKTFIYIPMTLTCLLLLMGTPSTDSMKIEQLLPQLE